MKNVKTIFIGRHGSVRLVWLMVIAAVMYVAAAVSLYEGYWYLYRTMMNIWCVTSENVARAPGAVQFLYSWSKVIVQLLQNALLIGFAAVLYKFAGLELNKAVKKELMLGAGCGAVCIAVIWCMLMLTGSVRLGWRLSRPAFSVNTLALLITTFMASLSEGLFFFGAMYGMMKKRLPKWAVPAVTMVLFALHMGSVLPAAFMNGMLTALVCCLMADKYGLGAAVGLRFVWTYLDHAVFGFAGAAAALYETYPVNLYWLCGGNAGIMNGVMTSAALIIVIYLLIRNDCSVSLLKRNKRSKSPS